LFKITRKSLHQGLKKDIEEAEKYKKQMRQDEIDRIPVEGKFGQLKRRFGLGKIMIKLAETTTSVISLNVLIANLEKILLFCEFLAKDNLKHLAKMSLNYWRKDCSVTSIKNKTKKQILHDGFFMSA